MLNLSELTPGKGSNKKKKKVARGTSSGHGKTGCRGHKGQKSRAGGTKGTRFEGGQTPLYRRLPKMGSFKNYPFRQAFNVINVGDLNMFENGSTVNVGILRDQFFSSTNKGSLSRIKILGAGELKKSLTVEANKFSKDAKQKIEKSGGKAVEVK